jgi:hypothetical protein
MNKQKPPVPKALEGGARSRKLRAQAGYKSQVLHVITVADDPRFVKWPLVPSVPLVPSASRVRWSAPACGHLNRELGARGQAGPSAVRKLAAMGAATEAPKPPPSTMTANATVPRQPMNHAWVGGLGPLPNSAVPVLP